MKKKIAIGIGIILILSFLYNFYQYSTNYGIKPGELMTTEAKSQVTSKAVSKDDAPPIKGFIIGLLMLNLPVIGGMIYHRYYGYYKEWEFDPIEYDNILMGFGLICCYAVDGIILSVVTFQLLYSIF